MRLLPTFALRWLARWPRFTGAVVVEALRRQARRDGARLAL